jgi:hypothetical protein
MSQRTNETRPSPPGKSDPSLSTLLASISADFYRENAFRRTGLPVVAPTREISKRMDQLKLAIELGNPIFTWAFAPEPALTLDQLRETAQSLKDPKARLLHELFWFWPEQYPQEEPDPLFDHLARAETKQPVAAWQAAASTGQPVALHNLAIYNHLLALEAEQGGDLMEDEMSEPWKKALRYWEKVGSDEALWQCVRARVTKLADPQLSVDFVAQLRGALLPALARVNGGLALRYAEKARLQRSVLHASLVRELIRDAKAATRILEESTASVARRIQARVEEARREMAADSAAGLALAQKLRADCAADLAIVESICGRDSELFSEVCTDLATAALDAVVAYQRATSLDGACLPLLIFLQTWPISPELRRRLEETFVVIYGNAMLDSNQPAEGGEGENEPNYAQSYRVVVNHVIPGMETLALDERGTQAYVHRVADLLRLVAVDACRERDDIAFAMHAFATLQALPGEPGDAQLREGERIRFYQNFELQRQKELHAEIHGFLVQIDARFLRFQDFGTPPHQIIGIRYGALADEIDGKPIERLTIAWCTAESEVVLDETNVFRDLTDARAHYDRILEALYYFLIPGMIERLVKGVRDGLPAFLGDTPLTPKGMMLTARTGLRRKEKCVSYRNIEHRIESGAWIATDIEDRSYTKSFATVETWNAAIMSYVIEMLARG